MSDHGALAGTQIPRWTNAAGRVSSGVGEYVLPVPPELAARLRSFQAARQTLLFVAHAKVLGALSAESTVLTGYLPPAGAPLRQRGLRLTGTWQDLLDQAEQTEHAEQADQTEQTEQTEQADPAQTPEDGAEAPEPAETLLDLSGLSGLDDGAGAEDAPAATPPADLDGVALRVVYAGRGDDLRLIMRFRRDVVESDFVARVAGYHLTALRLMTENPHAPHDARGLLSADEIDMQLHRYAGPRVPLPEAFLPELFRIVAESRPDDVAIRHGARHWSYRELNERANQVAHLLLRAGLQPEDVVAAMRAFMERTPA